MYNIYVYMGRLALFSSGMFLAWHATLCGPLCAQEQPASLHSGRLPPSLKSPPMKKFRLNVHGDFLGEDPNYRSSNWDISAAAY